MKVNSGWSVDVRIKCLPRIVRVEDIFEVRVPIFNGISNGKNQAINARENEIPIPNIAMRRLLGINHRIAAKITGIKIQMIGAFIRISPLLLV
jgi:hypothetical protein